MHAYKLLPQKSRPTTLACGLCVDDDDLASEKRHLLAKRTLFPRLPGGGGHNLRLCVAASFRDRKYSNRFLLLLTGYKNVHVCSM